ncbi:MAG: tRNA (N(6)-L-threonylcarbamoyladenosine(37)-C(2))-methylthiotransferase MtaB [Armatimonadetes bacterium]|nr:tRNA (N(6)-L-threonylcarbamoyladenosine(37)-C(2))-methylthiotransferase MtaB [Armatimonadota bacterium]
MKTIAYHTLGCKVNQYETEKMRESLEAAGFVTARFSSRADVYIINTCSVTHVADSKSRAAIRRALRLNPEAFVVVAGCYAELEPGQVAAIEGVDLVIAHQDKEAIPERLIARFGASRQSAVNSQQSRIRPRLRTRAVVKVQDGCDQFCAYCVIPYARVGKTSRRIGSVIDELKSLADFGYKEIVLAGIRLGSYVDENIRLPELIQKAAEIDGIERIRLSSIEPWEVDDALLDAMQFSKVCRHLHIPLQSGDDGVLKSMNRPYDSAQYCKNINRVRERIPGIGITTDVIVGFPGEGDAAFDNTCAMIERLDFSRLHVFRYSKKDRTKAAEMPDQIQAPVKKLRSEKLIELGKNAMARFASSLIGQSLDVLIESENHSLQCLTGFADNYVEVRLPGAASLKGEIVRVKISGTDQGQVVGVRLCIDRRGNPFPDARLADI